MVCATSSAKDVDRMGIPRIGFGYDVHQFAIGRKLMICGIEVPHDRGLLGHSDADVAIHALIDALLGAANLGDIGTLFPDNDNKYRDIDSKELLATTMRVLKDKGYSLGNADITIVAQEPKMKPHIPLMKSKLAEVMGCDEEDISIKATTTEHLGFTGRKEGIAACAVALIVKAV